MKYGFVIDNRKCIGCHACTVACKSEHDVPVGVNRTWVKQTEKGEFPHTRRVFSVLRCNHCSDAPCVTICPTQALFIRGDGIVDFDNDRCIGCKSCMQACPYDALYIDPETNTAAKCNYCAHRVDVGLEPACVNVCPEHAIVSGDMEDPNSEISQLISREQVTVRKPEKGTAPNVYYIDGDEASLNPSLTDRRADYIWSSQTTGVGHYAKYAEARTGNLDLVSMAKELHGENEPPSKVVTYAGGDAEPKKKAVEAVMANAKARRVYDTPDKGILWGWEVSAYVWTKAISAGAILIPVIAAITGLPLISGAMAWTSVIIGLVFLALTGALLIKDLDQPKRFTYVLLRPQWDSWLVRGGYAITVFGGLVSLAALGLLLDWKLGVQIGFGAAGVMAILVAVYTAFLFAQAKGRDFWQSPVLALHMLLHSITAGAAVFSLAGFVLELPAGWESLLRIVFTASISLNLVVMVLELYTTHPTEDAKAVVTSILSGRYRNLFWIGAVLIGNVIPLALGFVGGPALAAGGVLALAGIYLTEHIWVEAPQRIPLT